jgi:DNA-binding transcriptional ArsR family regulator
MSNVSADISPDRVFQALGEPVRRDIIARLRGGPLPVGKLADRLTVGRPAVSKHLRVLGEAGLVRHESRGTRNLYALAPEGMVAAQQWLVTMWDTALAGYAEAVEAAARSTQTDSTNQGGTP